MMQGLLFVPIEATAEVSLLVWCGTVQAPFLDGVTEGPAFGICASQAVCVCPPVRYVIEHLSPMH